MEELELLKIFDFFQKIETSQKPDLEKIQLMIDYAEKIFDAIKINVEEKIKANYWNDSDSAWEVRMLKPVVVVQQAKLAYKNYETEIALLNMERLYEFYKNNYEKLMQVHQPFFEYTLGLLRRVKENIDMIKGANEKTIEMENLKKQVMEMDKTSTNLNQKTKNLENIKQNLEEKLKNQQKIITNYKDWLDLISTEDFFSNPVIVRILANILAHDKTTRSDIATTTNIQYSLVSGAITNLIGQGIVYEHKEGDIKWIELNMRYLNKAKEDLINLRADPKKEIIATSNKFEEEKEAKKFGNKENSTGQNSEKQKDKLLDNTQKPA